ncbi:MAG: prephenate dehydrogenase/arogenate dehydrogenase family protein [Gemmataceae bacterium]|nr:prephenate dehydrogenase/arogenate dehydrogenase family protein [Gemmataceae bacterium]
MPVVETLTLLGTGMIGGSIGLAARKNRAAARVIGYDCHPEVLQTAQEKGVFDYAEPVLSKAVSQADLVICCAPVHLISQILLEASSHCKAGAILSDVGSAKGDIAKTLEGKLPSHVEFIPGHPIAGSEKNGPLAATDNLFEGRLFISTPSLNAKASGMAKLEEFWKRLGARVAQLDPQEHDKIFALTSHLPHLIAYALAGLLDPNLAKFTGGGFRDTTRVAGSDPLLWTEIFRSNRGPLLESIKPFLKQLGAIEQAISQDNRTELMRLLTEANQCRQQIP